MKGMDFWILLPKPPHLQDLKICWINTQLKKMLQQCALHQAVYTANKAVVLAQRISAQSVTVTLCLSTFVTFQSALVISVSAVIRSIYSRKGPKLCFLGGTLCILCTR